MQPLRLLIAVAALGFFFTPLLLLFGGVRATEFENRKLAAAPEIDDGWSFFDGATTYLVDHLPLREQAVRFNTWKSLNVFGTTPKYGRAVNAMSEEAAPFAGGAGADQADADEAATVPDTASQVLVGQDDWLFLQGDIDRACSPFTDWDTAVRRWERLVQAIRGSGREVVLVVAPDKASIYAEHLPGDLPTRSCLEDGHAGLWGRLAASDVPGVLPMRDDLLELKDEADEDVYHQTDSHWNSLGASAMVRRVVPLVGGRTIEDGDIEELDEVDDFSGDLNSLLGATSSERDRPVRIDRDDDDPRIPGSAVFVHDSFGIATVDSLRAESTELTTALWANDSPETIVRAIADADVVILETVEREVSYRALEVIDDEFIRKLERALRAAPR